MKEKLFLATDHAGFSHKEAVKAWLKEEGYEVVDCGATTLKPLDDFTDFVSKAAKRVAKDWRAKGIIFGGSGNGEAMMANRFKGVRAAVFYGGNKEIVTLSRQHNDANILSIGARFVDLDTAKEVIWQWLHTDPLPDAKYYRRNQKLDLLVPTVTSELDDGLRKLSDILTKPLF